MSALAAVVQVLPAVDAIADVTIAVSLLKLGKLQHYLGDCRQAAVHLNAALGRCAPLPPTHKHTHARTHTQTHTHTHAHILRCVNRRLLGTHGADHPLVQQARALFAEAHAEATS